MHKESILLADDDESVLVTMQAVLEMEGYEVTGAPSGHQAIELLRRQSFDLVLTDLRMEDVDGLEVLAEVRQRSPETVAIMLTGYASLESAVRSLREGAYAYLIKPCNVDELRATIARGMERRRLTRQLRERVAELEAANATIHALNTGLQARIDTATAELTQRMEEIARAKDQVARLLAESERHVEQLEELDRLKSQFLSMASHELKTPLTSISGYLQVALKRAQRRLGRGHPGAEEWQKDIETEIAEAEVLNRQTKRLTRLVNELLDVSRIQTGRIDFQFEEVNLRSLASEAVKHAQATTTRHKIALRDHDGDATIIGDRDHIDQVFSNLLSNAIKYSPDGGPITVDIKGSPDAVAVSVQDRGLGVAPDQRDAIFDLFYRSPDARSRQVGGMGLGLYISHEIVRRHGGDIRIDSEPGEGSTFTVTLPRRPTGT